MTYARSTYTQIIDDLRADLEEETRVAAWGDEYWMGLILRAEEGLTNTLWVPEEYVLRLTAAVERYDLQDRPPVTALTTATPVVATSAGHGLSTGDVIWMRDVLGLSGADGRLQVTVTDPNTFSLKKFGRVENASNDSPIVVTITDHPFATGDSPTIAGVEGNTAANGTNLVTVIDRNRFSIDGSTGNGTYTQGGTAVLDTAGVGTYVSGGRYWREGEVPTHVRDIRFARRVTSSRVRVIEKVTLNDIWKWKEGDGAGTYSTLVAPNSVAFGKEAGRKYLRFYPQPVADEDVTVFFWTGITPANYYTDDPGAMIHLSSEYEEMIKAFVMEKVWKRLKEVEMSQASTAEYSRLLQEFRVFHHEQRRMQVTYQ